MSAPKPHDPSQPSISPEELTQSLEQVLSEPASTLAEEAQQLEGAHRILSSALQQN